MSCQKYFCCTKGISSRFFVIVGDNLKLGIEHHCCFSCVINYLFNYLAIVIPALLCQHISGAMFVFHIGRCCAVLSVFLKLCFKLCCNLWKMDPGISIRLGSVPIDFFFFKSDSSWTRFIGGGICWLTKEKILLGLLTSATFTCLLICPRRIQFYLQFSCMAKLVQAMKRFYIVEIVIVMFNQHLYFVVALCSHIIPHNAIC